MLCSIARLRKGLERAPGARFMMVVFRWLLGTRSALFAPVHRLGLIVLDEEHEPSYKQDAAPRYHARDTAIELGRIARVPVVLSSATPGYHDVLSCRAE